MIWFQWFKSKNNNQTNYIDNENTKQSQPDIHSQNNNLQWQCSLRPELKEWRVRHHQTATGGEQPDPGSGRGSTPAPPPGGSLMRMYQSTAPTERRSLHMRKFLMRSSHEKVSVRRPDREGLSTWEGSRSQTQFWNPELKPETKPQNKPKKDQLIRNRRFSFLMNYAPILQTHDNKWVHSSPGGMRIVMFWKKDT